MKPKSSPASRFWALAFFIGWLLVFATTVVALKLLIAALK